MLVTMVGEHAGSRDGVIDSLIAGSGTDTLVASSTQGFYDFGSSDAETTIVNGASSNAAASNTLAFGASLDDQNFLVPAVWQQSSDRPHGNGERGHRRRLVRQCR